MALDRRISSLPEKVELSPNDVFPIVDSSDGSNKKVKAQNIANSGSGLKKWFVLTEQDIQLKRIVLPKTPTDSENVGLIPYGGPPQIIGTDYEINGNILSWAGLGLDGFLTLNERIFIFF
jgi:hypothetical protein